MLIFYRKDYLEGHLEVEIDYPSSYVTNNRSIINCLTELVKQHGQFQKQTVTLGQVIKDTDELIFDGQIACIPNVFIPKELIVEIIKNDVY